MFFRKQNTNTSLTDSELIDRYKNSGDKTYAGELFQRYSHLIFGVSMKYLKNEEESRDAVMNIFEKLFVDLIRFKVDHFKSWLHMVTRNHCLMVLRSKKHLNTEFDENTNASMENTYSLHPNEEALLKEDSLNKLDLCIEKLIEEQKACIQLFYIEEKCYKEVSTHTGYELGKVKSYIQNGKRNLKNCLELA